MPLADEVSQTGQPGYIRPEEKEGSGEGEENSTAETTRHKKRKIKPKVKKLNPTAIVKKLKLGRQGVSCCIDHLGPEGPECFAEGAIVYINRDHPLYQKEAQKKDTYILHIARLLTQEICLMKNPRNPKEAFQRQSKLLQDALVEKQKTESG
jgi:hypothetical protein